LANHDAGDGREGIHYEGGIPVFESPLERIEREQGAAKNRDKLYRDEQLTINRQQLRVNKLLMIFTSLLVLTSIISGAISIYQSRIAKDSANAAKSAAYTASQTLTEMKSGSGAQDTHTLAQQAVTQATQTTNLATAAETQATELRESIRQTGRLADAASRSADASNVSNSQSVALFERQNRPWIGVEGEPSFYQGPSTYGNSEIRIDFSIRNFGYSPAQNTLEWLTLVSDVSDSEAYKRSKEEIDKSCTSVETNALPMDGGDILLPGAAKPLAWPFRSPYPILRGTVFIPGCIIYRDSSHILHHTLVCYMANLDEKLKTFRTCWHQSAD
jgi:hypothetical protein